MKSSGISPSRPQTPLAGQDRASSARRDSLPPAGSEATTPAPTIDAHGPLPGRPPRARLSPTLDTRNAEATRLRQPVHHARQRLEIAAIANDFGAATTEAAANSAALRAVAFYTTNSTLINAPLREGQSSRLLDAFRRAVDHGLERLPGYGQDSEPLDRRVHFSREMLDAILETGQLTDPAFISTTAHRIDPATLSLRNTLIHLRARYCADVSGVSPDPHAREHLLRSNSTLTLEQARIHPIEDEDDPLHGSPDAVRAELWMRQKTPDLP